MKVSSSVSWLRVLVAGVATYAAYGVLVAATILVYTLLASGPQAGGAAPAFVDDLSGLVGVWGIPALTIFGAAWAARRAKPRGAVLHGLLVGLLVAIGPLLGPLGPPSPLAAALTVATGLLGGWLGGQGGNTNPRREG
jgi:hypothetical protein